MSDPTLPRPLDTDRNLLFGVLALQLELIDARQFADACSGWATHKHVPLADLLSERGWITPGDKADIDRLLERKLKKHGGDARAGLAGAGDAIRQTLSSINDPEIQRSLAAPPPGPIQALSATINQLPALGQRYSLQRLHATGGIGRIWLAHDQNLGRHVALKELRPEQAGKADLWARFLKEARITGQLEHPGIVPVYDLAQRPDNQQPFYTMQFIKGRTLNDALRAYHDKRVCGPVDALEFLALLNAFVGVCNTIAYAHARGVIHRDLKGQNVILGDFGEVVVLDWGLAKLVDRPDPEIEVGSIILDQPDGSGEVDLTSHGQALGTPAYMAPEQAEGRLDRIDRHTDIYGLGAMLYEILTGQAPFTGADTHEVLRKVRTESPVPPRQLCPLAPAALEAVCLKALAKRPEDRFAQATELAQEVQSWQEKQRRRAEEALRESEALYHSLVESLPVSVWRKDLEGRFTFANRRFCETVSRPQQEVIGQTDADFFPAELAAKYRRDDQRVHETGAMLEIEDYVTATGKRLYVEVVKTPTFDARGKVSGTQGIFWDLTEWKRTEEELRRSRERFELAVQGSQDGLWDWDLLTGDFYWSPRMYTMLGYEPGEIPCGLDTRIEPTNAADGLVFQVSKDHQQLLTSWNDRLHPEDRQPAHHALWAYLEGASPTYEIEYRLRHRDGSYRWILDRGVALWNAEGRPYRMAGSHEDITPRKDAEQALRQAVAELHRLKGA